ncbi:class I SAM-dependent methyltransferase [Buchnera aphidicola]|uniref:class I SAM-dependent methyltransferase n=1 Tax=Buchnera aphidicola TaxID=9 RepID=UPI0030EE2CD8
MITIKKKKIKNKNNLINWFKNWKILNCINSNINLKIKNSKIVLESKLNKKIENFNIDFKSKKLNYRIKNKKNLYKEKLIQAIGLKNKKKYIFDLTAGCGTDSFLLVSSGFKVIMIEKNPIISYFLSKALKKIYKNKKYGSFYKKNLKFYCNNSLKLLKKKKINPKIIYLDPMFKTYNHKSLPKKNIYFLRKITKFDIFQTKKLLIESIKIAKKVIIKRFFKDKKLLNIKPKNIIYSKKKKYRFEIYKKI